MDLNDPTEFDDLQVFHDPKGISIGSMDFDNPKVYGDTSIFDGLVCLDFKRSNHIDLLFRTLM